jgi:hypothetical protein
MEAKLALLPHDDESDEDRAKHRFLRGLLLWDLQRDYKARLWAEHKALAALDRSSAKRNGATIKSRARATIGPKSSSG